MVTDRRGRCGNRSKGTLCPIEGNVVVSDRSGRSGIQSKGTLWCPIEADVVVVVSDRRECCSVRSKGML